jgi:hypothetical protein
MRCDWAGVPVLDGAASLRPISPRPVSGVLLAATGQTDAGWGIVRGQTLVPNETGSQTFCSRDRERSGKEVQTCPVESQFELTRTTPIVAGTPSQRNSFQEYYIQGR